MAVRSAAEALAEAKRCAVIGRIFYTRHARERMAARGAQAADVVCALINAHACEAGNSADTWAITGTDLDDDRLRVIVAFDTDVVIVTLY